MYKYVLFFPLLILYYQGAGQLISLEELWLEGKYHADRPPRFNWSTDGQNYYTMQHQGRIPSVKVHTVKNGSVRELTSLLSRDLADSILLEGYTVSPDQARILFSTGEQPVYRRSSRANYYLFEVNTGVLRPLHDFNKGKISFPEFSPEGTSIAFVRSNNLYVTDIASGKEKAITSDGQFNHIINGACDWVYEEEFEFAQAFFWSPDGKKIVYYRFDESDVKEYNMQRWEGNYPNDYRYKYPKAGEENSRVSLYCTFLTENDRRERIDATIPGVCEYFPRVHWTGDADIVSYYRLNRLQNELEIIHYNVVQKKGRVVYKETDPAYVEINDNHFYLSGSEDFVFTSEKTGYRHIYRYLSKEDKILPLTSGAYEVTEINGIHEKNQQVYFTAQEKSPIERQLYVVNFKGKKTQLSTEKGVHTVSFSPRSGYYTDTYSDANTPPVTVLKETVTGKAVQVLTKNESLRQRLAQTSLSKVEFFSFTTTQKVELNGWIIKPVDFREGKQYPVLLTIYGGPGSQKVMDGWDGLGYVWSQMLAQKGYAVVCVDGRGTGGRGAAFKKCTQYNLGKYETEDLIETAKYLRAQPFADPARIGIFGWSFGGYLSSLAITKGADYFKTAVAVAPVTNWRYYDNIYTERYMGLPSQNQKGYDENAPTYYAGALKGNYLLIHGTADDNVHLQNAIEMQKALIKANKQFDMFYYPEKNHGIYGGNTRYHLYKMITNYILEKL